MAVRETQTLMDMFEQAGALGNAPFMSYVDQLDKAPAETMAYGEFAARAQRVAANLYRRGVRRGDRVALVALPKTDYVTTLAGSILLGAIPAPINHHFKARELRATLAVLEPAAVAVDDATCTTVRGAIESFGDAPRLAGISGCTTADVMLDDPATDYPRPAVTADDPALILHSSGTTGLPKLVLRSHGSIGGFLDLFAGYFGEDEHLLNFLPLYHQAGLLLNVLTACRLGTDVVQTSRYSTSSFWTLVDRYRATHVNLVSPMASFILSRPPADDDREHSLRWMVIAGRNDHWADFQDRFGVTGMTFYGSTETLQITSTGTPKNGPVPREILESVGAGTYTGPVIGDLTEFRVIGQNGARIDAPGVPGRIEARGQYCFSEYFNQPQQTKTAFTSDGWFVTGDLGYTTPDGALVLLGRESGMIRRSGENIAPREIELVLEDHPEIKEALVVGVPDEARGQEVFAQVVLEPGSRLAADDVFAYLDENVSSFKVPRYLEFRDEFERTATLKIKLDQTATVDRSAVHDRFKS
ncbi:acyl--CoA ligase [Amycolatopsis rubida]|uniref:Acyl--CoA ligase n=1 Tax=Amycolatopsis rubida TaxID=112413 RepID=A0ABX0BZR6_9PSEU|nr:MULTISPECIES: class I adenylate-forming enzyme family protein [Amycolatopsis]MYW96089.1 AMP-binding protein [Amycolatopsis rubida]NEC61080.1 acyl--CoA ligase [Amycolatopsis rubida]OAP23400.1 Long-chain-fatty-acid--CoA ligase [Amycolatopsis sp. M39]